MSTPMDGNAATYPPAEADRIFCPDCSRAVFYQRLHVSTHDANCSRRGADARYDGATDEQVAETILADLNYKRLPYERALIVTTAHVRNIRAAAHAQAVLDDAT